MLFGTSVIVGYISILPLIVVYTDGWSKDILLYFHALGITSIIYILLHSSTEETVAADKTEIYGLRHLLFNLELPPKTLWFNMGLWDEEDLTFPQACENLVHAVVNKMKFKSGSSVLDVGFGCGDSCIMLADQYKAKVTGITNETSQWNIASSRISSSSHLKDNITLLKGSADSLNELISPKDTYDYITSIDSAYHYNTRWDFLKAALSHLKPNGVIGLYDLAIEPSFSENASPIKKQVLKLVCDALQIPLQNLVTAKEYKERLVSIGYSDVEVEELDRELVFGGLSRSFDKQYETATKYGIGVSLSNKIFLKVSSFLFGLLGSKPWLVPVIAKGTK